MGENAVRKLEKLLHVQCSCHRAFERKCWREPSDFNSFYTADTTVFYQLPSVFEREQGLATL